MINRLFLSVLAVGVVAMACDLRAADRVVLLDGSAVPGGVVEIDPSGSVVVGESSRSINLQDLRRIERDIKPDKPKPGVRIYLTDDSVLIADKIKLESGKVTFDGLLGQARELPVASVRAILLKGEVTEEQGLKLDPKFVEALEQGDTQQDHAFVERKDEIAFVRGVIDSIGQEDATFIWNDKPRKLSRDKTYGFVFAVTAQPPELTGQAKTMLVDGSSVWGKVARCDGKSLVLQREDLGEVKLDWSKVMQLQVRSSRLVFLSDLKPLRSQSEGIVTLPKWTIERDLSVMGQPIQLGDRTYEKGLGMHANAVQVYSVGAFDLFAAMIGIDQATQGRGDCVFIVRVDGQEKFSARMKGGDQPKVVRVPVKGAAKLELVVDAGEDLDLADHADWADARMIKE